MNKSNNFRQFIETIMVSRKVLRIGIQNTPLQRTYQMAIGAQSFNIDFLGVNRQFDWLEISLTYDKSDKYNQFATVTMLKKTQLL